MQRQQQGFTLIELVIVIVILGILSAFALPRFVDLGSDARTASIEGARGAVQSAVSITRSAYLANGESTPVELDGDDIEMSTQGYPVVSPADPSTAGGIESAAQLSDEYNISGSDPATIALEDGDGNAITDCSFTYNQTTGEVSQATTSGC